jgi:SAM-dependent methyltransferase
MIDKLHTERCSQQLFQGHAVKGTRTIEFPIQKESIMIMQFRIARWSLSLLALTCLAGITFGQTQTVQRTFEPSVGQPGKDVVWVPTSQEVVNKMLDIAKVSADDYVIDLGSGDGRTVIAAAKRGARALGIEYNPDMVELSKDNAAKEGVSARASFVKADIFESDFSEATVITMFLLPELNLKLRPKILNLKPGTRIVSNTFTMGEWTCDESTSGAGDSSVEDESYGSYNTALLWIVPAKVAGTWRMGQDELLITQSFQVIEGSLKSGNHNIAISNGKLRGDQIRFNAGDSEYSGLVRGNRIQGSVKSGSNSAPWTAVLSGAPK